MPEGRLHLLPASPPGASALKNCKEFYGKRQGEVSHQVWPCMKRSWADRVCEAEAPYLTNHRHSIAESHGDRDVIDSEETVDATWKERNPAAK